MPIKILDHYNATMRLHDDTTNESSEIKLKVKRFSKEEFVQFEHDYRTVNDPPSERMFVRRAEGEEQERDDKGEYKISFSTIRERRLEEMTVVQREAWKEADEKDNVVAREFIADSIDRYVSVPAGEIQREDGSYVRTGAEFLHAFAAQGEVLRMVLRLIWIENTMSADEKKVWRSLFDLQHSLNRQLPEVLGSELAPIAVPADAKDSANSGDAIDRASTPSGSAAPENDRSFDTAVPSST